MAEAAAVCLEHNEHEHEASLSVTCPEASSFDLRWAAATDQIRAAHADMQDATEAGACGVAIALSRELLGKEVVEKSWKGRGLGRGFGFDYWLGEAGQPGPVFLRDLRLEVSGVLEGTTGDITKRLMEKVEQVSRWDGDVPGVAVVVGFKSPEARVGQP